MLCYLNWNFSISFSVVLFSYKKATEILKRTCLWKKILVVPDLVGTFLGNIYFYPNYGAHPWK